MIEYIKKASPSFCAGDFSLDVPPRFGKAAEVDRIISVIQREAMPTYPNVSHEALTNNQGYVSSFDVWPPNGINENPSRPYLKAPFIFLNFYFTVAASDVNLLLELCSNNKFTSLATVRETKWITTNSEDWS